jgi:beta-galactosidase
LGVGKGKLLVCGYDLSNRLDKRPATRQLRASLLAYMNSSAFKPHTQADEAQLAKMFPIVRTAPIAMPTGFENAAIYVKAGAKDTANGNTAWQPALDDAKIAEAGFGYNVQCDNVWKDSVATAWWSDSNLRIEVSIPTPKIYDFYVHFQDWNNYGREGKIKFQGREYELGPHTGDGKWVKLEVLREDYLAGKITLEAIPTAGGNLLVTAIALVPRQ